MLPRAQVGLPHPSGEVLEQLGLPRGSCLATIRRTEDHQSLQASSKLLEFELFLHQLVENSCSKGRGTYRTVVLPHPPEAGHYPTKCYGIRQFLARHSALATPDARCYDALGAPPHILPTRRKHKLFARKARHFVFVGFTMFLTASYSPILCRFYNVSL